MVYFIYKGVMFIRSIVTYVNDCLSADFPIISPGVLVAVSFVLMLDLSEVVFLNVRFVLYR